MPESLCRTGPHFLGSAGSGGSFFCSRMSCSAISTESISAAFCHDQDDGMALTSNSMNAAVSRSSSASLIAVTRSWLMTNPLAMRWAVTRSCANLTDLCSSRESTSLRSMKREGTPCAGVDAIDEAQNERRHSSSACFASPVKGLPESSWPSARDWSESFAGRRLSGSTCENRSLGVARPYRRLRARNRPRDSGARVVPTRTTDPVCHARLTTPS